MLNTPDPRSQKKLKDGMESVSEQVEVSKEDFVNAASNIKANIQSESERFQEDLKDLKETFHLFCFDILGLKEENDSNEEREVAFGKVVDMLLEQRMMAKANKDWATSDKIRNELTALGFEIKDGKDRSEWKLNK